MLRGSRIDWVGLLLSFLQYTPLQSFSRFRDRLFPSSNPSLCLSASVDPDWLLGKVYMAASKHVKETIE